ncbi:hypothetical protein RvY_19316 [Ramazzottius varieornatus]|uniref:Rab3 GTPase-activating protein catalytic subunit n=1 Tax=Ramazzottius varieornatus TaxID=947166 RepID=A0A1D1W8Z8_RAMVA|nr:hypothetical protein RvY_19316 [Ramazzottius varieornatus]
MVSLEEKDARAKFHNNADDDESIEDPNEVFEITDFTTASDWERLIARLEDVINEWKLPRLVPETKLSKGSFVTNKWKEYSTDITDVPDYEFIVKRFQLRPDEKTDVSALTSIVKQSSLEGDNVLASAPRFASLSHSEGDSYP